MASRWPTARACARGRCWSSPGAGTGKTSTIAHRVPWLVMNGVDPARILLLTFTRRAATEMRRRAHDIVRQALDDTLGNTRPGHAAAPGLGRHFPLDRQPAAAPLRPPAQPRAGLHRHRPRRFGRSVRQPAPGTGLTEQDQRFPRKDTCLAIYSWRINTQKSLHETLEQQFHWCLNWEQDLAQAVSRLRRAQAALRPARLRRPAALLARDDERAEAGAARRRQLRSRAGR